MLTEFNFKIIYYKELENSRVNTLSWQFNYNNKQLVI